MKEESEKAEEKAEEKSEEESMKLRIKKHVFDIYCELLRDRSISFSMGSVLMSIMFLQLFGYIYYRKTDFPFTKDEYYEFTCEVLESLRIYPQLEAAKSGYNYIAFGISMVILILLYISGLLYVNYSILIKKFHFIFPVQLLRILSLLFYWVLLNPIIECFVAIFSCDSEGNHIVHTQMECWTGIHLFYVFLFTFFFLCFILILFLISCFYNVNITSSTDILARADINMEIYFLAYRVLLAIFGILLTDSVFHWVLIIFYLIFSISFLRLYLKYLPYYHSAFSVLFGTGIFSYFWFSVNLLLTQILDNYSRETIIIIIGILISYPLVRYIREEKISSILFDNKYDKIKKEWDIDIYVNKLTELITNSSHSDVEESILVGFIAQHRQECSSVQCPLNHDQDLYLANTGTISTRQKSNIRDPIVSYHLVDHIQSEYSLNSNASAIIHIIYSQFLLYKMGNFHMSLIELKAAEKCSKSIQQEFSIYRFKAIIEGLYVGKYYNITTGHNLEVLDITIALVFESLYFKLQRAIERSSFEHIEFWCHLDSMLPDLNLIHKLGLNIIIYTRQCTDLWNKLIKINKRYHKALHIYGYYLTEIKNDQEEGEKLIEEARGLSLNKSLEDNMNDYELMFADDTALVVISGNKEDQLRILKSSSGIMQVFGYNPYEIIGRDVNILQPKIVADAHQMMVEQYYHSARERVINNETSIFAAKRSGYLFGITLIIKPVPLLSNGIQYIGLIRPAKKESPDLILTDFQGKIDSISEGLAGTLGIPSSQFLKENEVYIQFICPDLLDPAKSKKKQEKLTKFELWTGFSDLNIQIPKNFSTIVQKMTRNIEYLLLHEEEREDFEFEGDNRSIDYSTGRKGEEIEDNPEGEVTEEATRKVLKEKQRGKEHSIRKIIGDMLKGIPKQDSLRRRGSIEKGNILKIHLNYEECEYEKCMRAEIVEHILGNGKLRLKLLKFPKQKKFENSEQSSTAGMNYEYMATKVLPEVTQRLENIGLDHGEFLRKKSVQDSFEGSCRESKEISEVVEVVLGGDAEGGEEEESKQNSTINKSNFLEASNMEILPLSGRLEITPGGLCPEKVRDVGREIKVEEVEKEEQRLKERKRDEDDIGKLTDDVGSITSGTHTFSKFLRDLRMSMYEKYNPPSVQRLKLSAQIVFLVLVGITTIYFVIASALYSDLKNSIEAMENANYRLLSNIRIGASVRSLYLMNEKSPDHYGYKIVDKSSRSINYKEVGYRDNTEYPAHMDYEDWNRANLMKYGGRLKEMTNYMATEYIYKDSEREHINPKGVSITYNKMAEIPNIFIMDCWSAYMGLVIHAFKIQKLPLVDIKPSQQSVAYVLKNSLQDLLHSTDEAIDDILKDSTRSADSSRLVLLLLLIVASMSLIGSLGVIFPVIRKVSWNKVEMLTLFLEIPRKCVRVELSKCRKFFNMVRGEGDSKVGQEEVDEELMIHEGELDEEEDIDIREGQGLLENELEYGGKHKANRKYKPFHTRFLYLIIKFFLVLLLLESYFLLSYFNSDSFLNNVTGLLDEAKALNERQFTNSLLFIFEQELLGTNGTSIVYKDNIIPEINILLDRVIEDQAKLLKKHSSNTNYHKGKYKSFFKEIVYTNGCERLYVGENLLQCNEFLGGILLKGIHSANVAYWDSIREATHDYLQTPPSLRTFPLLKEMINGPRIVQNEMLKTKYFSHAYAQLSNQLEDSLHQKFNEEYNYLLILFICFIALMLVLYLFGWSFFLETTKKALWTTKSMLAIVPPQAIVDVKKIREFLVTSSKSMIFGISDG